MLPFSFLTYVFYTSLLSSAPSHLLSAQLASPFSLPLNPVLSYFCHTFIFPLIPYYPIFVTLIFPLS